MNKSTTQQDKVSLDPTPMKQISKRDIKLYQPSDNRLESYFFGNNEIQVRDMVDEYSEDQYIEDGRITIIYDPYKFIGFINLDNNTATIEDIHIHPKYRNKGIAKSFINSFIELCQKYNIKTITGIPYKNAINFWEHQGFKLKNKITPVNKYQYIEKQI